MVIRTHEWDYLVLRHVRSGSMKDIYICRRVQEEKQREYTVIRVRDVNMCQRLLTFFTQQVDKEKFSDFVEYFTLDGKLHFVFLYSPGIPLMKKLTQEHCSFAERLEIAQRILERIFYLSMPYALQADGLELDHIVVDAGLDVRFHYELSYMNRLTDYTIREVGLDIDEVFRKLFFRELDLASCPELSEYMEWLGNGDYQSYMEIFYHFNKYYVKLREKTEEELSTPRKKSFKAWEKLRKAGNVLKKTLAIALLIGALGYLIYSIVDLVSPKTAGVDVNVVERYEYIGTLEIQDGMGIEESLE